MRQLFAVAVVLCVVGQFHAAADDVVKVKLEGVHLCCGQCVKGAKKALEKEKIDKAAYSQDDKTITFEAMPADAEKAIKVLYDNGFAGKATIGGKAFEVKAKAPDVKDEIVVKNVHVCCGQCVTAVKGLFKDMKGVTVMIPNVKGVVLRDVTVSGKDLTAETVLKTLNDGGFNGVIEAKK
jgi:bacterioferritin-associated ferredoxin